MAISQNDYVTLTQNHLNNYCLYKQFITNRDKDLADLYGQLDDVSVAISKYGNEPPGGGGGSPVVEREAEMRGRIYEKISKIKHEKQEVEILLGKLEAAMELLNEKEKDVIYYLYIKKLKMETVKDILHYSDRYCRRLRRAGVNRIAITLYGPAASENIYIARVVE